MIVEGGCDALPEQAFYMVGTIEEALAKGEEMKKETGGKKAEEEKKAEVKKPEEAKQEAGGKK
jgi:hypothetical protein